MKIKRALLSVSNKDGIVELARRLHAAGVEIISTGGTMKAIKEAGIPVTYVSDVTGFPEIMDGRVKTLNPFIHGGILSVRDNEEYLAQMQEHGIKGIDLVVVNLYPFKETIAKPDVELAEAVENIDIGGPAMIRAAAKNFKFVTIVTNPARYEEVAAQVEAQGEVGDRLRMELAQEAFAHTADYDTAIKDYLARIIKQGEKA
jgi:phosphoribosylaminoimidazolecarboxamide formyltransferase/IMP cyclohydrolase